MLRKLNKLHQPILLLLLIANHSFPLLAQVSTFADLQRNEIDSLHRELATATNDSLRFEILNWLKIAYWESNLDSTLYYIDKSIELTKRLSYDMDEIHSVHSKAFILGRIGLFEDALTYHLLAQDLHENQNPSNKHSAYMLSLYGTDDFGQLWELVDAFNTQRIGSLYYLMGNFEKALTLFDESTEIFKKHNYQFGLFQNTFHYADLYMAIDQLDSALKVSQEADQFAKTHTHARIWNALPAGKLGETYLMMGDIKKAEEYFVYAMEKTLYNKNQMDLTPNFNGLGKVYLEKGDLTKALHYSTLAIENALLTGAQSQDLAQHLVTGYLTKSNSFNLLTSVDSAYYYLSLAKGLQDSLQQIKQDNINRFNAALLEQNLRNRDLEKEKITAENQLRTNALLGSSFTLILIALLLYRNNRQQKKSRRKTEIAYERLQNAQSQLIQSEKMASLGELTAGIAHEIQNPLNFVNNFSEVNDELIEDLREAFNNNDQKEIETILKDLKENESKIKHHGQRADSVVKGMLQHSRTNSGEKEPTDINALADEYLRLAYHGMRARDKNFNAEFKTVFDPDLPKVNVVSQDIGRVLLNLINNAFYAVDKKAKENVDGYKPEVTISTKSVPLSEGVQGEDKIEISVKDNGPGITDYIKDKIFQPFFTTKPTGSGTGLGLSLSYDIVKAHGGEINVDSEMGRGSEFVVHLPIV